MKLFKPIWYQENIFKINYLKLKELGYKVIIFDLDNTLGSIHDNKASNEVIKLVDKLKKDFKVYILSNSNKKRVVNFCESINCNFIPLALKPSKFGILKIKKQIKFKYDKMVIIGDQLLTDIFLGNRLGLLTILVDPIKNKDFKITILNRKIEKRLKNKYQIKRGNYYEK